MIGLGRMAWRGALALVVAWGLTSCGGGSDLVSAAPGVGTGGTGNVAGAISGLGSVIVDGVRYDESQAALERRPDLARSEALALADLQVGQYVYMDLDAAGVPTRVRVESQLVGVASGVSVPGARFSVWGQQVAINTDPARGPVTVIAGNASLVDLEGAEVQVFGTLQSADAGDVLLATRVEKLASAQALPARVTGTLRAGAGGALLLGGVPLDTAQVAPAVQLSAGSVVTAIVPWTSSVPAKWQASAVAGLAANLAQPQRLSGAVHLLPSGAALVQGVVVDLSGLGAAARQQVREGSYLTLSGVPAAGGSGLVANAAEVTPQEGRPAQLRGSITSAAGLQFVLRGQAVDAASAQFTGGTAADLVAGRYVEVQGTQRPNGVVASRITVTPAPPDRAVVEVNGTVQAVDTASRRITVRQHDGRTVQLAVPASLALPAVGDNVHAAGYWSAETVQVRDLMRSGKPG